MMMKRTYVFLVIFLLMGRSFIFAQPVNDNTVGTKNSISINFLEPMLKVISKSTNVIDSGLNLKAPILYYSRQTKKMSYRIGTRVSMKHKTNQSDLFSDKKEEILNRYDVNLSVLRRAELNSKISIAYGPFLSSFAFFDKKIFDSGFDKVTFNNKTFNVSGGLNLLLQFAISKRLSIFTEYLLGYQYLKTYSGKEFSAFPEENYANEKSTQYSFQFDYPISLYISYHF